MVTRVYTPLIQPYNRTQAKPGREGVTGFDADEEQQQPFRQAGAALREQSAVPDATRQPSGGLQSVQMDRFQKIPLKAVLTDFKNTMTALGADEKTQSEVAAYLNVVSLQAAKERPEVSFIKHTLRTAAGSLDQFITHALGQPSQVVKEWVDALLLQDIDYKAGLSEEETARLLQPALRDQPDSGGTAGNATPLPVQAPFTAAHKSALKSLIDGAKQDQQAGQAGQADAQLQEALNLLAGKEQPALEGKVWHLRGRFQEKEGRWQEALGAYEQAAGRFAAAGIPDRQAQSLSAMGRLLEAHGRLGEARDVYAQVVALDEQGMDKGALVQSLNDLGSAHLGLGETEAAVAALRRAWQEGKQLDLPPLEAGDLLSNLGAAYRLAGQGESAIKAYKRALACAEEAQDFGRYGDTLRQLAALFVATNQPEQAMKALKRLTSLPA